MLFNKIVHVVIVYKVMMTLYLVYKVFVRVACAGGPSRVDMLWWDQLQQAAICGKNKNEFEWTFLRGAYRKVGIGSIGL